jgi:TolA-binding protein/TM2 domain-containing membrane protein YozV
MRGAQRRQWTARVVAVGLLLALFHAAQPLGAQPPAAPSPERSLEGLGPNQLLIFADHLLHEGEYFRAITEYRRFLFTYPADPRASMVLFRIGQAFFRGESYAEALKTFQELERRDPDGPYGQQARLWQGESLLRQAQYAAAEQIYTRFIDQTEQASLTPYAHYQRGWTFLYRRQWQEAAQSWQRVPPDHPLYPAAQQLVSEAQAGERLPQKSPALAGLLSGVLPGSGQLYNGRLGDALLAFLLNGLFIAGTIEAIDQGELAVAGVLSFFEAGWYVGNVYGAVNGAHKHNRHATETMLKQLEQRFRVPPPGERISRSEIGLRISFGF